MISHTFFLPALPTHTRAFKDLCRRKVREGRQSTTPRPFSLMLIINSGPKQRLALRKVFR